MKRMLVLLVSVALLTPALVLASPGAAGAQSVINTVPVGRRPIGVGVNHETDMIYVADSTDGTVSVIDGGSQAVVQTVEVGSNPSGVGVNPDTNRVYVANGGDDSVAVINGEDNNVIADVGVGDQPWNVCVNPVTGKVYVSNYNSGTVTVIDGGNNTVIATVNVGSTPCGVCVNPVTNKVYVARAYANHVSVIDGETDEVTGFNLLQGPIDLCVDPYTNMVYVTRFDGSNVAVVDGDTNSVVATVAVGSYPQGVCVNPGTRRAYVANWGSDSNPGNSVSVIDCDENMEVAILDVGDRPLGVDVNPDTHMVYVSNGAGDNVSVIYELSDPAPSIGSISPSTGRVGQSVTLDGINFGAKGAGDKVDFGGRAASIVSWSDTRIVAVCPPLPLGPVQVRVFAGGKWSNHRSFKVVGVPVPAVPVGDDPRGVGVNPDTDRVYVSNHLGDNVSVLSGASDTVIATVPVGHRPNGVGVNPVTNKVYVANTGESDDVEYVVSVFNGADYTPIGTVAVGDSPYWVAVNPVTNKVYVTNSGGDGVSVIDGASDIEIDRVEVPGSPYGVAVNPVTNKVYVANRADDSVWVIDGASDTAIANVPVGRGPRGVDVNPDTNRVYAVNWQDGTVSVIDGARDSVLATVAVRDDPVHVGVNPAANRAYVTNAADDTVSVIDVVSNAVIDTVTVGSIPVGVGVNPVTSKAYVADSNDDTVSVIHDPAPAIASISPTSGPAGCVVSINGARFGSRGGTDKVTFGGKAAPTRSWSDTRIEVACPPGVSGKARVKVHAGNRWSNAVDFTVDEPVDTPSAHYLAEGTNAWGFATYISIANPGDTPVTARLTYMDPGTSPSGKGRIATRAVTLPPLSQTTVSSMDDIGEVDFSTKVECPRDKTIAVDRTMYWSARGSQTREAHSSIGARELSRKWYLPEGSSAWGFETWTLVANPNEREAHLTLTYMTQDSGPMTFKRTVPANSRASYLMASDIGERDSSIQVTSDVPMVAERSQYRDDRRQGSCSIGSTAPGRDYFLAEGSTAWGFTSYVLVQNPNDREARVTLTCMTPRGPVELSHFEMPAHSRKTLRLNDVPALGNTDLSTHVRSDEPIVAERAMYWDSPAGQASHDSIGLDSPHTSFYLPDGQTSDGWRTYTLVQNPNSGSVTVEITYLPQGGGKPVTFKDEIPPGSRRTYSMAGGDSYPGFDGRASTVVRSLDRARPVMVERSMYWNDQTAGTNTLGAR